MKINAHTSHPSAFISSTFLDLREERRVIASLLREYDINVNALDVKPASTGTSRDEIIKGINESDFVILIVGTRYGSTIPQITGSEKRSVTWWEYAHAQLQPKDTLVFLKEGIDNNPLNYDDPNESSYSEKTKLLSNFKEMLIRRHNPKYFSSISDLKIEVRKSLIPTYRSGILKLLSRNEKLSAEILNLKQEHEKLKSVALKSDDRLGENRSGHNALTDLGLGGGSNRLTLMDIFGDSNKRK